MRAVRLGRRSASGSLTLSRHDLVNQEHNVWPPRYNGVRGGVEHASSARVPAVPAAWDPFAVCLSSTLRARVARVSASPPFGAPSSCAEGVSLPPTLSVVTQMY